jgi:hypothetical protein
MRDFFDIGRLVGVGACGPNLSVTVSSPRKSGTPLSADSRPAEVCVCVCDVGVGVRGWSLTGVCLCVCVSCPAVSCSRVSRPDLT